jgi:hypothetical protein
MFRVQGPKNSGSQRPHIYRPSFQLCPPFSLPFLSQNWSIKRVCSLPTLFPLSSERLLQLASRIVTTVLLDGLKINL